MGTRQGFVQKTSARTETAKTCAAAEARLSSSPPHQNCRRLLPDGSVLTEAGIMKLQNTTGQVAFKDFPQRQPHVGGSGVLQVP